MSWSLVRARQAGHMIKLSCTGFQSVLVSSFIFLLLCLLSWFCFIPRSLQLNSFIQILLTILQYTVPCTSWVFLLIMLMYVTGSKPQGKPYWTCPIQAKPSKRVLCMDPCWGSFNRSNLSVGQTCSPTFQYGLMALLLVLYFSSTYGTLAVR